MILTTNGICGNLIVEIMERILQRKEIITEKILNLLKEIEAHVSTLIQCLFLENICNIHKASKSRHHLDHDRKEVI